MPASSLLAHPGRPAVRALNPEPWQPVALQEIGELGGLHKVGATTQILMRCGNPCLDLHYIIRNCNSALFV